MHFHIVQFTIHGTFCFMRHFATLEYFAFGDLSSHGTFRLVGHVTPLDFSPHGTFRPYDILPNLRSHPLGRFPSGDIFPHGVISPHLRCHPMWCFVQWDMFTPMENFRLWDILPHILPSELLFPTCAGGLLMSWLGSVWTFRWLAGNALLCSLLYLSFQVRIRI